MANSKKLPSSLFLATTALSQAYSRPESATRTGTLTHYQSAAELKASWQSNCVYNEIELSRTMNTDKLYLDEHNALILEAINAYICNQHIS